MSNKPYSLYDHCGAYITTVYAKTLRGALKSLTAIRYGTFQFRYENSSGKEMRQTVFLCG